MQNRTVRQKSVPMLLAGRDRWTSAQQFVRHGCFTDNPDNHGDAIHNIRGYYDILGYDDTICWTGANTLQSA